jgi:Ribbon-helix-helix protein, copG family
MTTQKRVTFYADAQIEGWLSEEAARTGAPVGELIRRAVRLAAFGEAQAQRNPQPVLFAPRRETR